jgi:phosphosulfolactate synthase (CoM biosynthesis protein A)
MQEDSRRAFASVPLNRDPAKPRRRGLTEIRGPYYSPMGPTYLRELLDAVGDWVDSLKFAGGSFAIMRRDAVRALVDVCHAHDVKVSTGGFVEHVLALGPRAVDAYVEECKALGFDVVEISSGFVTAPEDDLVRLSRRVQEAGLVPKPEVGIRWGAGGGRSRGEPQRDVGAAIRLARAHLEAGAPLVMIESEGITEDVDERRADVVARVADELGLERVMFEAADPDVFSWYVRMFGPEVNLFVDHSQVVQLECLRSGLWGTAETWGRIVAYRPPSGKPDPDAPPASR